MNRKISINYCKLIAMLLVMHCHTGVIFPENLSFLSFGGDLGNNLFFAITGYLLVDSVNRSNGFIRWYLIKLANIVPLTVLMLVIAYHLNEFEIKSINDIFFHLLYPGYYWYLGALVIFYIFAYLQIKLANRCKSDFINLLIMILCVIADFLIIVFRNNHTLDSERYLIGYAALSLGMIIRNHLFIEQPSVRSRRIIYSLGICFSFGILICSKYLYSKNTMPIITKSVIDIVNIAFVISVLCFFLYFEDFFSSKKRLNKAVILLSSLTYSAYLIEIIDSYNIYHLTARYLAFPISYVVSNIFVIIFAYVLNRINLLITRLTK